MRTGVRACGRGLGPGRGKLCIKVWARPCPSWASRDELLPGLYPACFAGLLAPTSVLQATTISDGVSLSVSMPKNMPSSRGVRLSDNLLIFIVKVSFLG